MNQRFAYLGGLAALLMTAASFSAAQDPATPVMSVRGELLGEPLTPEEFQEQRLELFQSLYRDGLWVGPEASHRVEPDMQFYSRLKESDDCATCGPEGSEAKREWVGVDIDTNMVVDFTDFDPSTLTNSLSATRGGEIRQTELGEILWTTQFESPGAAGLRLRLDGLNLPEGVELYVFNEYGDAAGPYTGTGDVNGNLWTTELGGDRLYVELVAEDDASLLGTRFVVGAVVWLDPAYFGTYPPDPRDRTGCPGLESCINSERCYDATDFSAIENAVKGQASILFSVSGGSAVCTGGLVADSVAGSNTPYFITAHHCFSTQSSASSASFTWDFRKTTCTSSCPSRFSFPSSGGATLLVTLPDNSSGNDLTFLRLNTTPPGQRYYYGWTTDNFAFSSGTDFWSVHHPGGNAMMYSEHDVNTSSFTCSGLPRGRYIYLTDREAGTSGGSSGCSLLRPDPLSPTDAQIVGQLFGSCGINGNPCDWANNRSVYGSFGSYFGSIQQYLANSVTVTVDQAAGQADPAASFPIDFTIEFSEDVSGFTINDVDVSGTALILSSTLVGGPQTYTYRVNSALPGSITVNVGPNAAESVATPGLTNEPSTSTDNTVEYIEAAPSNVTVNQSAGQDDPTSAMPITFEVEFTEDVTGFTFGDVVWSGTATGPSGNIIGGPRNYTVNVTSVASDGTLVPSIPADSVTGTSSGLGNEDSTSSDNSVTYDSTAPQTSSIAVAGTTPNPATAGDLPLLFLVQFNEGVNDVLPSNVIVTTSISTPQVTVVPFGTQGVLWRVFIDFPSAPTISGDITVGLDPAGITDLVGNPLVHGGQTATVTYNAPASVVGWQVLGEP